FGGSESAALSVLMFNPDTKIWSTQSAAPLGIQTTLAWFTYQNKAYVLGADNKIWEYEPNSDSWRVFTTFPGSSDGGLGMAQVIGDRVFIGFFRRSNELMELDMNTLVWKSKNPIPGIPQSLNAGYFSINDNLYFLRCPERTVPGTVPMELYRFDPDGI
ncbi:MAG TPA: hypothetical protein VLA71_12185, partial [Algoriphagus sp.]|nr:hypothetical protein [Algoriphagus sp.]